MANMEHFNLLKSLVSGFMWRLFGPWKLKTPVALADAASRTFKDLETLGKTCMFDSLRGCTIGDRCDRASLTSEGQIRPSQRHANRLSSTEDFASFQANFSISDDERRDEDRR